MEFFAIASPELRDRLDTLLRDGGEEANAPHRLLDELQACTPAEIPAVLQALALRPGDSVDLRRAIENAIKRRAASVAGGVDLAWTWLAAWMAHCGTPDEFSAPFCTLSVQDEFRSGFLLSELARATAVSTRPDVTSFFLAPAISQLGSVIRPTGTDAIAFGIAIARLVYGAAPDTVTSPVALAMTDACLALGPEAFAAFQSESDICTTVATRKVGEELPSASLASNYIATAIVLDELRQATQGQSATRGWSEPAEARHRRMDALVESAIDGAGVEESSRILLALSTDSDLFLRCAAVRHAIAATTNFSTLSKQCAHDLRETVNECVRGAFSKGAHHWLKAAVLASHCDAEGIRASRTITARWAAPAIGAFHLQQELLAPDVGHPPGLSAQVKRFIALYKRVALVLPNIEPSLATTPDTERRQANKGSPPLGLGQIASHLASRGHFVRLYDAHRYSYDQEHLARELAAFDVVGVSVVFSTIRSTAALLDAIRDHGRENAPTLVIGGHAPTLMTAQRIQAAGINFDYLVVGPGEEALEHILGEVNCENDKCPRIVSGSVSIPLSDVPMSNNRELASARSSSSSQYQHFIEHLAWLDRAIFADATTGLSYEPSTTRNGRDVEAHLVLSRGCDWRCSFCTEALIAGQHGENRRSVQDVIGEIKHLVRHYGTNRIQFIDDNVLPTLPPYKRRAESHVVTAVAWAEDLLTSLSNAADSRAAEPLLRWRGLMRVEDFLLYETLIPCFVERLAASGCNLLAFGFECGSEKVRARMKGGDSNTATNVELVSLVARLRTAGIFVKGYFIIGGPHQTKDEAKDTISFAVSSGLDLAYFAIFKDFRGIVQTAGQSMTTAALRFQLFSADVLDAAANDLSSQQWEQAFGTEIPRESRPLHIAALKELHHVGFSFNDLVRYNDYHEWMDPYAKMGFVDHEDYFKTLCEAYLRFYARPEWIDRYRALVRSGY